MSKPSWNSAPRDAEWLAQDECGEWFWHQAEPSFDADSGFWLSTEWFAYAGVGERNEDAFATLEKRPSWTSQKLVAPLKVLVACEYSGRTRDAFLKRGHDAISCDFHETEVPGPHYRGDVRDILYQDWDLIIAHPDCTYLTNAGVRWLYEDCKATTKEQRWELMREACDFFNVFLDHPCKRICVENPVPHKHAVELLRRNWDQSVHPYEFGDPTTKRTCYWLKGLPTLKETNNIKAETMAMPYGERAKVHYASPGPDRWKFRSRTPIGFAEAMAEQWGGLA